jgi:glutaconate CoA-transferase subunit B
MPDSAFAFMVANLARFIQPNEVAFSGVNSTLAMLACLLAKRAYDFDFTYLNVAGGVDPTPRAAPLSSSDPELAHGSRAIFANEDFYDLCARGGMDLCFLGAAQIDPFGRTNVSVIGNWHRPKVRLPGGGGAAVMLPTARKVVTWRTEHSPRTLVETLDFVTGAGNMHGVVTPIAVFTRAGDRLALQAHHPAVTIDDIRSRTGFRFDAAGAAPAAPLTPREAEALRSLDPDGRFEADAGVSLG